MRLTKDLKTPHDDTTYSDVVKDAVDREDIVLTKLKHYEDLEELGYDSIEMKKLIDRDIAKKPIICSNQAVQYGGVYYYKCPSCKTKINKTLLEVSDITLIITTNLTNFCPKCGQKIDWE